MQKLTMKEMMDKFDPEVHEAIREAIRNTGATELLWAENQQIDSSAFGARSCIMAGPTCTYKSHEECEGKWIKDLPSQRQYFIAWCKV